jgi:hypothetical protein
VRIPPITASKPRASLGPAITQERETVLDKDRGKRKPTRCVRQGPRSDATGRPGHEQRSNSQAQLIDEVVRDEPREQRRPPFAGHTAQAPPGEQAQRAGKVDLGDTDQDHVGQVPAELEDLLVGDTGQASRGRTDLDCAVGAGAALLAGFATPAAAAAVIGTMAVAGRTVHLRNGLFITDEGYEYVLAIASAATAASALGAEHYSIDAKLGRRRGRRGGAWVGVGSAALGLAAAAAHLAAFWRKPGATAR